VPGKGAVLADVTVINPGSNRLFHQIVTVRGSTIESIADVSPNSGMSPHARRYAGSYVLPGMIDMHVHHPAAPPLGDPIGFRQYVLLFLTYGVTTVRDAGDLFGTILDTRRRILDGEFAGPRIFACGPFLDGDPPLSPLYQVVRTAAEAERAVDELARKGVHCIKAYQNLSPEALAGLRAAATRHHLPLIGHLPTRVPLEQAHLDDIQHTVGVLELDSHLTSAADYGHALISGMLKLDDARMDVVIQTSLAQKIAWTPTMTAGKRQLPLMRGAYTTLLQENPATFLLPRYWRDLLWKPGSPLTQAVASVTADEGAAVLAKDCFAVRRLHEAGVILHVGTDTMQTFVVPGAALQEELRSFVRCGFTPEEAWAAATWQNGAALPEPNLGLLQSGAPADLLVFREDPTRDLAALTSLEAVIADGRLYPKEVLDEAVERNRQYFDTWLYDYRMMAAVRRLLQGEGS
jgi:imidazolonepropionase-like amidohydrolase